MLELATLVGAGPAVRREVHDGDGAGRELGAKQVDLASTRCRMDLRRTYELLVQVVQEVAGRQRNMRAGLEREPVADRGIQNAVPVHNSDITRRSSWEAPWSSASARRRKTPPPGRRRRIRATPCGSGRSAQCRRNWPTGPVPVITGTVPLDIAACGCGHPGRRHFSSANTNIQMLRGKPKLKLVGSPRLLFVDGDALYFDDPVALSPNRLIVARLKVAS